DFNFNDEDVRQTDAIQDSENSFHILENNRSYKARLIKSNFNKRQYVIEVNGNTYSMSIANALDMMIDQLGLAATSSKKANDIKAPMPGLIVSVDVQEGQQVKEGDTVVVLEAMKMENALVSPGEGIIQQVFVNSGDKVDKNQLLIEIG
ncbi:MAG: acetyl-CoA carboxylase biotin carboxyl carrier protein subunit, partial [Flavobacteriaceae bacterium]|nr:acetyl-CoA carboxylase biotin carboxyl carrier protein subunit [Flavobacteriaceae bacterium]